MGTITFEKTAFTPTAVKATKFFAGNVSISGTSTISFASTKDSVQMYKDEVQVKIKDCTYRSYELYIDDDADLSSTPIASGDNKGASGMARVTYEEDKTADDGYDVYIKKNTLPATGSKLSNGVSITAKALVGGKHYRLVIVAEKEA